jgi:hypothetical protein
VRLRQQANRVAATPGTGPSILNNISFTMSGTTTSTPSNVAADVHFAAHEPANQMLAVSGRGIAKLET